MEGTKQKSSWKKGEILVIPRTPVIGNARNMVVSVQRVFEGTVFQAKVIEEERIGMRKEGDEDILVEEARMLLLQEELRATEVPLDLKVISFEGKINNKGFLLQRWQLDGEGGQQVG